MDRASIATPSSSPLLTCIDTYGSDNFHRVGGAP